MGAENELAADQSLPIWAGQVIRAIDCVTKSQPSEWEQAFRFLRGVKSPEKVEVWMNGQHTVIVG